MFAAASVDEGLGGHLWYSQHQEWHVQPPYSAVSDRHPIQPCPGAVRSDDKKKKLRPGSMISNESRLKPTDSKQSQIVTSPSDRPPISSVTLSAETNFRGEQWSQAFV